MRDHSATIGGLGLAYVMAPRQVCTAGRWRLGAALLALCAAPAIASPLARGEFDALAKECAVGVSPEVLRSVASKESGFEPFALHNNTRKLTRIAGDARAAAALAQNWIAAGDSVDVGLMQINAPNLAPLGLTVAQAFDPCSSLAAGASFLRTAYDKGSSVADQQAALLIMLSRYNTGRPLDGLVNGYVGDIIAAASSDGAQKAEAAAAGQSHEAQIPSWDIWAGAAYARAHGASWIVDLAPTPPTPLSLNSADHQPRKP